jgi:hypothetical protein
MRKERQGLPVAPYFYENENGEITLGTNYEHLPDIATLRKMRNALMFEIKLGKKSIDRYNLQVDEYWEKLARIESDPINKEKIKQPKNGFIYVVKSGGFYKIGRTKNRKRIKTYITENPNEIEVCLFIESKDCEKTEKILLEKYRPFHYRGEWFAISEGHLKDIEKFLTLQNK